MLEFKYRTLCITYEIFSLFGEFSLMVKARIEKQGGKTLSSTQLVAKASDREIETVYVNSVCILYPCLKFW